MLPDRDEPRFNLASAVRSYAFAHKTLGHWNDALRLLEQARGELEVLHRKNPHGDYYQIRLHECLSDLAGVYSRMSRFGDALAATKRAADVAEALVRDHPASPVYRRVAPRPT